MENFGGGLQDISNLSSLLNESRKSQEKASERTNQPPVATGQTNVVLSRQKNEKLQEKASSSIWTVDEIPSEDAITDTSDTRPVPRYETSYQQSVGTEDTFLGLSDKTPLSGDCTHLIVKVHFPGCLMRDLDLDVTKTRLKASSKTLRLFIYLPVEVLDAKGSAKFDKDRELLVITLPIDHGA